MKQIIFIIINYIVFFLQGELWKEFNDQAAANLEHFYIRQFMKKIKEYFIGNICNTKCLKIIQGKQITYLLILCGNTRKIIFYISGINTGNVEQHSRSPSHS